MVPLRAAILLLASSLLLAACATNSAVQLYPGAQRPATEVLTVRVPGQLVVYTINGKKVDGISTFFSSGYKDLKLAPGRYDIIAYYKELWDLSPDEHTTLSSDPVTFVVDGKAGETWQLGYAHPKDVYQARSLAAHFSGWTENLGTGDKTPTHDSGLVLQRGILATLTGTHVENASDDGVTPRPETTVAPQGASAPAAGNGSAAQSANAPAAAAGSYLDTLKAQWSQATPAERRAFLQWVSHAQ